MPLFQILESRGFKVCLINARYVQNVPGRKANVFDCQWLRYLHAVGLLRGSFRQVDEACVLRSLLRHRDGLIQMAATHVLRRQKAVDQMNLQIHHVISDITGLKIIDAVLEDERDGRIKASETTIMKSMVKEYLREHRFTLRQCFMAYRNYQQLIADCDKEIGIQLGQFIDNADLQAKPLRPTGSLVPHFRSGSDSSARDKCRNRTFAFSRERPRSFGGRRPLPPGWSCTRITTSA